MILSTLIAFAACAQKQDGTAIAVPPSGDGYYGWSELDKAWYENTPAQDGGICYLQISSGEGRYLKPDISGLTLGGIEQIQPSSSTARVGYGLGIALTGSAYIRALYRIYLYETAFTGTSSDTVALDGVFGFGMAMLDLWDSTFTGFGAVIPRGVTLSVMGDGATALTEGNVRLEGAEMTVQPRTATAALTQTMAGDTGAKVTVAAGHSHLKVARNTASAYTLATGTLTNEPGGVLSVSTGTKYLSALGETEIIKPAKVGAQTEGLMPGWLVGYEYANPLTFLALDATKGLIPAETTAGLAGGADVFAKVTETTTAPAGTTTVKGLLLDGAKTITLNEGSTLAVGSAGETSAILLNFPSISTAYQPFAGAGTISFGGDGVIWARAATVGTALGSNGRNTKLTVGIRAAGDMTFAGSDSAYVPRYILSGANDWPGDTHVSRAMMDLDGLNDALPSGTTLYVHGNARSGGAQLFNYYGTASTLDNDLHISGWGMTGNSYGGAGYGSGVGAIYNEGMTITLNGTVTLDADACFHVYRDHITFNGPVTGPGSAYFKGTPEVHTIQALCYQLNAANDYAGATTIDGCSMTLGENGTFGQGAVTVKNAVDTKYSLKSILTINAPAAGKTIANDIDCSATTLKTTGNSLALTGKTSFANVLTAASTVLTVKDMTTGSIADILPASGDGTVKAADGSSVLTIDSDADETTKIVLADGEGKLSIVKAGTGTLTLENAQKFTGTTTVKAGTLKIGSSSEAFAKLPLREHVTMWLDASQESLCRQNADGCVTNWVSGVSDANVFGTAPCAAGGNFGYPKRIQSSSWGSSPKYVLNFTSEGKSDRLLSNAAANYKHVFIVAMPTECGADTYTTQYGCYFGEPPNEGETQFLRNNGGPYFYSPYPYTITGKQSTDPFLGTPFIASIDASSSTRAFTCSVGGSRNNNSENWARRPAPGEYAEIIGYGRALTADEIAEVQQYLANKWLDQGSAPEAGSLSLDPATQLVLEKGAKFDLNGQNQTVAALSGEGEIVNSSATPVTLTVSSSSAFKGRVGAGVTLALAAGGKPELVVSDGGKLASGGATTLAAYNASTAPTNGLLCWLDASAEDTVLSDEDGLVTNWLSRVDGLAKFEQYGDKEIFPGPKYEAAAFNGKPALLFGESTGSGGIENLGRLSSDRALKPETVFLVFKPKGGSLNASSGNVWSPLRDDGYETCDGIKFDDTAQTSLTPFYHGYFFPGDAIRVDGVDSFLLTTSHFKSYVTCADSHLYVVSARRTGEHSAIAARNNALGMLRADLAGYKKGDYRTYHGHIAEVLAYDRILTDDETAAVEKYLTDKWGDETPFPEENTSVFEGKSDLTIGTTNGQLDKVTLGGTVDLSDITVRFTDTASLDKTKQQPYLTVTGTASGEPNIAGGLGGWGSTRQGNTWSLTRRGLIVIFW